MVFNTSGEHLIKLTISNGKETYATQKTVTVKPAMTVDFDWRVEPINNDYRAPVLLHLKNLSTNAFSYEWLTPRAAPSTTNAINPDVVFPNDGIYTIELKAKNDKEIKSTQKQIKILPTTNLLSFTNIKLGINSAHATIGCFFSSYLDAVLKKNDVTAENGGRIDFVFFGLNPSYTYNQFVSPDEAQNTSFTKIPNATHTKIINAQELTGAQLSVSEFDALTKGADLNRINVAETNAGKTPFSNALIPRVILFQTQDGRKGAVKIKDFVTSEAESYILVDIKVQKQP